MQVFSGRIGERAALVNRLLVDHIGWRGLLVAAALSALLGLYIRRSVAESAVCQEQRRTQPRVGLFACMRGHWKLALYLMLLMAACSMFSHGWQNMCPTFLQVNLHLPAGSGTAVMLAFSMSPWMGTVAIVLALLA